MRIGKPELVEQEGEVQIRASIQLNGRESPLWYSVERCYAECLTTRALDAFVLGLLLPAMKAREDIRIEGSISERLYWNLTHHYMRIMTSINPALHHVRLLPEALDTGRQTPPPAGVASGFSGGVDSFCVLADHFFAAVPRGYRITHLLFNNVGSHGRDGHRLFLDRYERLRPCTKELGIPFIRVDSNLDDFYTIPFQLSHSPRNISGALLFQGLFGKYLYASAFRYEDCFVGRAPTGGYADPATIHLFSTENLESISSGSQYSRIEKTSRVAGLELSHRYLNVCVDPQGNGNCGMCWKCTRTLLTIELLGKTSLYDKVFPLHTYRSHRSHSLARILSKDDPLTREVLQLARQNHHRFPRTIVALAALRRMSARLNGVLPRCILRPRDSVKGLVGCHGAE